MFVIHLRMFHLLEKKHKLIKHDDSSYFQIFDFKSWQAKNFFNTVITVMLNLC